MRAHYSPTDDRTFSGSQLYTKYPPRISGNVYYCFMHTFSASNSPCASLQRCDKWYFPVWLPSITKKCADSVLLLQSSDVI